MGLSSQKNGIWRPNSTVNLINLCSTSVPLHDYRTLDQKFDRIVSVGMFEHVGIGHYQEYFDRCFELLEDDGVMVLHSIGRAHGPSYTSPFIEKYIFPGGYIPALSEVLPMIEKSGFVITDVEILRLHYAKTIQHWRDRFDSRRADAVALCDERFCRMWDFYLSASQVSFESMGMMNFQIQLTKKLDVLPLTRNYMEENERKLRRLDEKGPDLAVAGE
jgi:cyclopropane-fatty-acyl-phospholipid synthase